MVARILSGRHTAPEHGSTAVRLSFAAPMTHLKQLCAGVAGPLLCRCDLDRVTPVPD